MDKAIKSIIYETISLNILKMLHQVITASSINLTKILGKNRLDWFI